MERLVVKAIVGGFPLWALLQLCGNRLQMGVKVCCDTMTRGWYYLPWQLYPWVIRETWLNYRPGCKAAIWRLITMWVCEMNIEACNWWLVKSKVVHCGIGSLACRWWSSLLGAIGMTDYEMPTGDAKTTISNILGVVPKLIINALEGEVSYVNDAHRALTATLTVT